MSGTTFVQLQPGDVGEAAVAARLTYESDPPYYDYWLGDRQRALTTLQALWRQPLGSYSAAANQVLRDQHGLAAIVSSYPAASEVKHAIDSDCALRNVCSAVCEELMQREADLAYLFPRLPENAWYLRSLAVAGERRGQGMGENILAALMQQARAQGFTQMLVDVDSGNPGAVRFYSRNGFSILVETKVTRLLPHRLPASLRMARLLGG